MNWLNDVSFTRGAALRTSQTLFPEIKDLKLIDRYQVTPQEFDSLNISNHRVRLGASLLQTFPKNDRPRGDDDLNSVNYFLKGACAEPVAVLLYKKELIKLDGVHRLVAAYILDSPIKLCLYEPIL